MVIPRRIASQEDRLISAARPAAAAAEVEGRLVATPEVDAPLPSATLGRVVAGNAAR